MITIAEDIAYLAQNPYSEFHCHKTLDYVYDDDDNADDAIVTPNSLICAGFRAMQINEGAIDEPEDYEWPDNVYSDIHDMTSAYEEEWNRHHPGARAAES